MTRDEALAAAERVLSLVNSQPRTPTKEQVAEAIGYTPSYAEAYATCLLNFPVWEGLSRLKPDEIQSEEF